MSGFPWNPGVVTAPPAPVVLQLGPPGPKGDTGASAVLVNARFGAAFSVPITGPITLASNAAPHAIVDTTGLSAAAVAKLPALSGAADGVIARVTHQTRGAAFNVAVLPTGPDTIDDGVAPAQVLAPGTQGYWVSDKTSGTWRRLNAAVGHVSVLDFGAYGDGAHDDQPAIQAAVDSRRDVGGIVFFPESIAFYGTRAPIRLDAAIDGQYNDVELVGEGYTSHIRPLVAFATGNNPTILFQNGFVEYGMKRVGLRRLRVSGYDETTHTAPIVMFNSTDTTHVLGCYFDTNRNEGVYWNGYNSDRNITIRDCYATRIGGWSATDGGFCLSAYNLNGTDIVCDNCRAYQCGQAIEQTGNGCVITNGFFDSFGASSTVGFVALNLQTTNTPPGYGRLICRGNVIRNCSAGIQVSTGSQETIIESNVIELAGTGIDTNCTGLVVVRGNYIYDSYDPNSSGYGILVACSGQSIVEHNTIVAGPTYPWAYAIFVNSTGTRDLVRNNVVQGAVATTRVFVSQDRSPTEFVDNVIIPGTLNAAVPRYRVHGTDLTLAMFAGLDTGATISTLRPSSVRGAAVPSAGTWSVGDRVENTAPAASGVMGWVCVTAGTPGTWKSWGSVSA